MKRSARDLTFVLAFPIANFGQNGDVTTKEHSHRDVHHFAHHMKTATALCLLPFLFTTSRAQFWSLPPSSTVDGVIVNDIGQNAAPSAWSDPSGLQSYSATGDGNSDRLSAGAPDSHSGLTWLTSPSPSIQAAMNQINTDGGAIRAIFVGETAGWLDDFGYTYSGNPSVNSYTAFKNIQSVGANPTVQFGQSFDITLLPGQASQFDFWLNGVGATGSNPPPGPSAQGGIYTAFHPANGSTGLTQQFLWAQSPLMVNTYDSTTKSYATIGTYLLSAEDWRLDAGSDSDYSDLRVALQFFDADGDPLGSPVPEPSSTAILLGASILAGVIIQRFRATRTTQLKP